MCDYSLHNVATRPAQIEDKLVTTKFNNSITRGFAAVGEPRVPGCRLPGTEIAFDQNAQVRAVVRRWHSREQENRTAARALPANQHAQRHDPS